MGKKRPIVVLSSDDDEETIKKSRPSSSSRSKSCRRQGRSNKPNVGISRARSSNQDEEAAKFDKLSDDFGECLRDFSIVPGSKCTNMKEIWVDKYKPSCLAELAVHKKKVDEVNRWLEARLMVSEMEKICNSTLVITGPAGVGKSAAIHVIVSQLGAELCEWTTPTPTLWREHVHNSNSGRHYMSKLDEFVTFIEKVGTYSLLRTSSISGSRKPIIVLIDDLPVANGKIAFVRLSKCLAAHVRSSSQAPTVILITECHKTESAYSSTDYSEELLSTLEKAGAHKVVFNPLTVNAIKKTLFRICKEEKCNVTAEWIDYVARASGGDIRHAITSLQYLCLIPVDTFSLPLATLPAIQFDTTVDKHNFISSPSLAGSEDVGTGSSYSFGRDETMTLFHALGKFLHNKRETAHAEQDSLVLQGKLSRNPLKMDTPEKVISQAHGQARNIVDFLHENVLDFISDEAIDDAWLVASYLCDADFLFGSALRPTRHQMMSEMYESENLAQSVAASVAARGVLFGNSHPAPSRWHKIRSPRLWQIEQLSRHNKSQMSSERFEGLNSHNLQMLPHISFEYGSTIKWLRSKNPDDDSDWMSQENDKTSSEEIEEDDIDDW